MSLVLRKAFAAELAKGLYQYRMGIPLYTTGGGAPLQNLYVEGFGGSPHAAG